MYAMSAFFVYNERNAALLGKRFKKYFPTLKCIQEVRFQTNLK